jgi:hypothetical protein
MWPFLTAIGLALIAMWVQQRKDAQVAKESAARRDQKLQEISVNVDGNLSKAMAKIDSLEKLLLAKPAKKH